MEPRRVSTIRQLEMLLDFVANRKDLALGRLRSKEARAISARLWRQCAKTLNSAGPVRTPKEWSKVWNDLKCRVRTKLSNHSLSQSNASDRLQSGTALTGLEARVANIIGCKISRVPIINHISRTQVFIEEDAEMPESSGHTKQESNESFFEMKEPPPLLSQSSARLASPLRSSSSSQHSPSPPSSLRHRRQKSHKSHRKLWRKERDDDNCGVVLKLEEMRARTENLLAEATLRQAEAAKAQAEAAVMSAQADLLRTQTMAKFFDSLDSLVPAVRLFLESKCRGVSSNKEG